jgi:hypothetical protein
VASVVGTQVAVRRGSKIVVSFGLAALAIAYAWASSASTSTSYTELAGQMVLLGTGMGLTSAPATESIMGAVGTAKAGVGSAINDTTRELGAALGVAVIGSVFASLYSGAFSAGATHGLPAPVLASAEHSVGAALITAQHTAGTPVGARLAALAHDGFFSGLHAGCLLAAGVCAAGAILCAILLPAQPPAEPVAEPAVAGAVA